MKTVKKKFEEINILIMNILQTHHENTHGCNNAGPMVGTGHQNKLLVHFHDVGGHLFISSSL